MCVLVGLCLLMLERVRGRGRGGSIEGSVEGWGWEGKREKMFVCIGV